MVFHLVLALATLQANQLGTSICGKVRDPASYTLPGAEVRLQNLLDAPSARAVKTDIRGEFCFDRLEESLYSLEVSSPGFLTVKYYPIHVTFPLHLSFDIKLILTTVPGAGGVSSEATVSGTLRVADQLLKYVSICLISKRDRNVRACSKTNELGQYSLLVAPGTYWLEIRDYTNTLIYEGHVIIEAPGFFRDYLSLQRVPVQPYKR